jgi:hypothetical protein
MSHFEDNNLIETRNRLLDEIRSFDDAEFNKKPAADTWSAAQVCHHLYLAEKSFTKAIVYGLKKSESKQTDPKNITVMADRTKKMEAPDLVKPNSEYMAVQHAIEWLHESRNELMAVLNTVEDRAILAEKSAKHAIFGEISLDQWVELLYLHEQRHAEQLKEIKGMIGAGE